MTVLQQRLEATRNKNRAKRYPPEVKALAVECYLAGRPIQEIAARTGVRAITDTYPPQKKERTECPKFVITQGDQTLDCLDPSGPLLHYFLERFVGRHQNGKAHVPLLPQAKNQAEKLAHTSYEDGVF